MEEHASGGSNRGNTEKTGTGAKLIVPPPGIILGPGQVKSNYARLDKENRKYNSRVHVLDKMYSKMIPLRSVLVRMFVTVDGLSSGGVHNPSYRMVPVPTQSGQGMLESQKAEWQFARYGIVVAVAERWTSQLEPGEFVMVAERAIQPISFGKGSPQHLPTAFTGPGWSQPEPPTSVSNPHFGYLKLDPNTDIEVILPKSPLAYDAKTE